MKTITALSLFLAALPLSARTLHSVDLAEHQTVAGQNLRLNGAGLRTATIFKVKVYVAAFYAPAPMLTAEAVYQSSGPLRFEFHFLRDVDLADVKQAWTWQFDQSRDHYYEGLDKDKERFVAAFGALKKFGVEAVEIEGDQTRVYDQGELKATIPGKDFQRAFLSIWVGKKPVSAALKAGLLRG